MKQCPECRRIYDDETLKFCLDDGASLLYGPGDSDPATHIIGSAHVTSEDPTRTFRSGDIPSESIPSTIKAKSGSKAKLTMAAVGFAVLILAIAFLGYRYINSNRSGQIGSIAVMPFVNASGDANTE